MHDRPVLGGSIRLAATDPAGNAAAATRAFRVVRLSASAVPQPALET